MGLVEALTEWRARRWLSALVARIGAEGLTVAASVPGLGAVVDQHAAAVRDIVDEGRSAVLRGGAAMSDRVLLAGYGRGLVDRFDVSVDQVRRYSTGRWTTTDWLALRLLAVCAQNRSLGSRPLVGGTTPGWSAAPR